MRLNLKTGQSIAIDDSDIEQQLRSFNLSHLYCDGILKIPQGVIGLIETPNNSIEIKPSIDYLSVFDYLRLSYNLPRDGNRNQTESGIIHVVIIKQFIKMLRLMLRQGIPPKYIMMQQRTDRFQGRVDLIQTYINSMSMKSNPVQTNIEHLCYNYTSLQIIRNAYLKIRRTYPVLEFEPVLNIISPRSFSAKEISSHVEPIQRNNEYLRHCLDLAKLILLNMTVSSHEGIYNGTLLVNCNTLFENHCFNVIKNYFQTLEVIKHPPKLSVCTDNVSRKIQIQPDILLKGTRTIILDAKNKHQAKYFNNADFYQIYTYCKAYDTKVGVLIYPSNESCIKRRFVTTYDTNVVFYSLTLDIINRPDDQFSQCLERIYRFG